MIPKRDIDLVPCAFVRFKYGLDVISDELASSIAEDIHKLIKLKTGVQVIDFNLQSFDTILCEKPEDLDEPL